jgi:hypothetical protein
MIVYLSIIELFFISAFGLSLIRGGYVVFLQAISLIDFAVGSQRFRAPECAIEICDNCAGAAFFLISLRSGPLRTGGPVAKKSCVPL